jgi:hypothetical protein
MTRRNNIAVLKQDVHGHNKKNYLVTEAPVKNESLAITVSKIFSFCFR